MSVNLLIDSVHTYIPALILAMVCGVSILHFKRTKEKGYLAISIGFVILTIGWLALRWLLLYMTMIMDLAQNPFGFVGLILSYVVFYIVPALLILIGFIAIYKEGKRKQLQATDTSRSG